MKNETRQLTTDRIDSLAALLTVTAEQLEDRRRAEQLLSNSSNRTDELISLVFDGTTPSIENYLAAKEKTLEAA